MGQFQSHEEEAGPVPDRFFLSGPVPPCAEGNIGT